MSKTAQGFGESSESKPVVGRSGGAIDWAELEPKEVDYEGVMNKKDCDEVWAKMMLKAGLRQPDERTQAGFRLSVYMYCLQNGTSREGNYAGKITMHNGHRFEAAVIPQAASKMHIRRFMRGNAAESYEAFKSVGGIRKNGKLVVRASQIGASTNEAFATADWLNGYEELTPSEQRVADNAFKMGIVKAKLARGKTLEDLEGDRLEEQLQAQSSVPVADEGKIW